MEFSIADIVRFIECPTKYHYGRLTDVPLSENAQFKKDVTGYVQNHFENTLTINPGDAVKELGIHLVSLIKSQSFNYVTVHTLSDEIYGKTISVDNVVMAETNENKVTIVLPYLTNSNFDVLQENLTYFSHRIKLLYLLGAQIYGSMFDGITVIASKKSVPSMPAVLKSGKLSRAKTQNTTRELYTQAIKENGLLLEDYTDLFEDWPMSEGQRVFTLKQTQLQMDQIQLSIQTVLDTLEHRSEFSDATASAFGPLICKVCPFKRVCINRQAIKYANTKQFIQLELGAL